MAWRHDGAEPPLLLDLGCGEGGASEGYNRAGFAILGIDANPMPRYPFNFMQADMIDVLRAVVSGDITVDAIHASPPCQKWSAMSTCRPGLSDTYPDLITPLRFLLRRSGVPAVIENVEGSPLIQPVVLCGSHFGLSADWEPHGRVYLRRHRLFESHGFVLPDPGPHVHDGIALTVAGHGRTDDRLPGRGFAAMSRRLMDISWMTRDGLDEAVPPPYAEYVGRHMMAAIRHRIAA